MATCDLKPIASDSQNFWTLPRTLQLHHRYEAAAGVSPGKYPAGDEKRSGILGTLRLQDGRPLASPKAPCDGHLGFLGVHPRPLRS